MTQEPKRKPDGRVRQDETEHDQDINEEQWATKSH